VTLDALATPRSTGGGGGLLAAVRFQGGWRWWSKVEGGVRWGRRRQPGSSRGVDFSDCRPSHRQDIIRHDSRSVKRQHQLGREMGERDVLHDSALDLFVRSATNYLAGGGSHLRWRGTPSCASVPTAAIPTCGGRRAPALPSSEHGHGCRWPDWLSAYVCRRAPGREGRHQTSQTTGLPAQQRSQECGLRQTIITTTESSLFFPFSGLCERWRRLDTGPERILLIPIPVRG